MNRPKLGIVMGCAFIPLFFSVLGIFAGIWIYRDGLRMKANPQEITLQELIENGASDNEHLMIDEARILASDARVQHGEHWNDPHKAWIPLVPVDADQGLKSARVMLISELVSEIDEIQNLNGQEIHSVVVHSLDSREERFLQDNFPGVLPETFLFLEHKPATFTPTPSAMGLVCSGVSAVFLLMIVLIGAMVIRCGKTRASEYHSGGSRRGDLEACVVTAESVEHAARDMIWFSANRSSGFSFQQGVAVLRPDYFAFLPTAESRSIVGSLVETVSPIQTIDFSIFSGPNRLDELVQALWQNDPGSFDTNIRQAAEQHGGYFWQRLDVIVARGKGTKKDTIYVSWGGMDIFGAVTPSIELDRLLEPYRRGPIPVRSGIYLFSALATFVSFIAVAAFYLAGGVAFYVWVGIAIFLWLWNPIILRLGRRGDTYRG